MRGSRCLQNASVSDVRNPTLYRAAEQVTRASAGQKSMMERRNREDCDGENTYEKLGDVEGVLGSSVSIGSLPGAQADPT